VTTFLVWFDTMKAKSGTFYDMPCDERAARKHALEHDNYRSNPIHVLNTETGEKTKWTILKKVEAHRE
jgi:hypothetical protein